MRGKREQDRTCTVGGCPKPFYGNGLCSMHYQRVKRHGTTDKMPPGKPEGVDVGYGRWHQRLVKHRGAASGHKCALCDSRAQQWAFQHDWEGEIRYGAEGERWPYALSFDAYKPMCISCHKAYDLERIGVST